MYVVKRYTYVVEVTARTRQPVAVDLTDQQLLIDIGRNLAAERARRGLSQEQVARSMGVLMQQYSKMERGEHDTGITKYVRAARAIGVPVSALFHGLDEEPA
jgi:DNA-binding XRE family transcriptional regulator